MSDKTEVSVCWLPYQDQPFVHMGRDGKDWWLKRDGEWTDEDGHPEAGLEYCDVSQGRSQKATCACVLAEPCGDDCSCRDPLLSGGCDRCATYGSGLQRLAMAGHIAARLDAAAELAASDPIRCEDEDEGDRREVWCEWCYVRLLANEYFGSGGKQGADYPHEDDCTWVRAGGRDA